MFICKIHIFFCASFVMACFWFKIVLHLNLYIDSYVCPCSDFLMETLLYSAFCDTL